MKKSGLGDSPFFNNVPAAPSPAASPTLPEVPAPASSPTTQASPVVDTVTPATPASDSASNHAGADATMTPRHHDSLVERIRKSVKEYGKEAATHRFTPAEKQALADVVYQFRRQGVRTSENEVTRIAIQAMLQDYAAKGADSLLARVLQALNG